MMKLLDQPMRMKYYFNGRVADAGPAKFEEEWYDRWLASMVNENDEPIFFLVTETTDVFEKEPGWGVDRLTLFGDNLPFSFVEQGTAEAETIYPEGSLDFKED